MDNGLTLYVQVKHGIVQIAFLVISEPDDSLLAASTF